VRRPVARATDTVRLIDAVLGGDEQRVGRLLEAGADPNAPVNGTTPLYQAAVQGFGAIVDQLLRAGADPNVESGGDSEGLPLCAAASWGHEEAVSSLLRHGADANGIEWGDMTALAWAAGKGHVEVTGTLLRAGADPNLLSPLVGAAKGGSPEVVRLLLDDGARPSSEALDWAEQLAAEQPGSGSHAEVAEILRAAGAGS